MIVNWSVPSNTSVHLQSYCNKSHNSVSVFLITRAVLTVPFGVLVLYLGYQRWRQRCSFKSMSHCDMLTYHTVLMQLTEAPGLVCYLMGYIVPYLSVVGLSISAITTVEEILFHVLTCVDRYLAVIHPITYLKLKNSTGVTIRNISVGGVWIFSLGWSALVFLYFPALPFFELFSLSSLSFAVVSFCSLSVLRVLVRPRPGEARGDRVDQAKKNAFKTIATITGVLWLLFFGYFVYFVCFLLQVSSALSHSDWCLSATLIVWLSLPSSLVVPFLFLYRAEKKHILLFK